MLLLPIAVIVLMFFVEAPVYAYLDPGTGSMALQAILGGIAAALAVGRIYWSRIRDFVWRNSSRRTR